MDSLIIYSIKIGFYKTGSQPERVFNTAAIQQQPLSAQILAYRNQQREAHSFDMLFTRVPKHDAIVQKQM
jgi:hypothetical protein